MIISAGQRIGFRTTARWVLFITLFCVAPLGCSWHSGKGTLEVQIKDHREAIGDFSSANIVVESIRLSPKVGLKFWQRGWRSLKPAVDHVDLTHFVGHSAATIVKVDMDSGTFEALDLKLRAVEGVLKKDSAAVPISNKLIPVALPFSVNPGEVTRVILDLSVMDLSDHPPEAYELQLVGYEVYRNGKIITKIPPE
jgi:Domain of unknown function (DUF4382)